MAVPKRKKSRSRTRSRRSQWKATTPAYAECPRCHQAKLPHRVCANCGYYAGRQEQLRLAEHEEVVRRAHEEAARILSEGQTAVRELRREADAYADERLREVADALRAALEVVGRTETGLSQGLAQAELGRERLGVPFDTPAEATVPSGPFDEEMRP